jgi:hypothetical protein
MSELLFPSEIKICGTPQDDCSEFATCADTGPATFTCTCNEGYTGDGRICKGTVRLGILKKYRVASISQVNYRIYLQ